MAPIFEVCYRSLLLLFIFPAFRFCSDCHLHVFGSCRRRSMQLCNDSDSVSAAGHKLCSWQRSVCVVREARRRIVHRAQLERTIQLSMQQQSELFSTLRMSCWIVFCSVWELMFSSFVHRLLSCLHRRRWWWWRWAESVHHAILF